MSASREKRCACIWYDAKTPSDARTCWDLRYYGRSPVARGGHAPVEGGFWLGDPDDDGECECSCHDDEAEKSVRP